MAWSHSTAHDPQPCSHLSFLASSREFTCFHITVVNLLFPSGLFTFLLPSYSTFKALKQRPLNEQELEKWAGYWTVVGILVAFEYTAEWLLSW